MTSIIYISNTNHQSEPTAVPNSAARNAFSQRAVWQYSNVNEFSVIAVTDARLQHCTCDGLRKRGGYVTVCSEQVTLLRR